MSSDAKRGAPTEDGVYEVLLRDRSSAPRLVRRDCGEWYYLVGGGPAFCDHHILCHRPHTPLTIPPLKMVEPERVVVRDESKICPAYKFTGGEWVRFVVMRADGNWWWTNCVDILTPAEVEAAGYEWPWPKAEEVNRG